MRLLPLRLIVLALITSLFPANWAQAGPGHQKEAREPQQKESTQGSKTRRAKSTNDGWEKQIRQKYQHVNEQIRRQSEVLNQRLAEAQKQLEQESSADEGDDAAEDKQKNGTEKHKLEEAIQEKKRLEYEYKKLEEKLHETERRLVMLMERNISDINQLNREGQNKLQIAIRSHRLKEASQLIRDGINLKHADQNRRTALHYAVQHELKPLIKEMMDAGLDINAVNILDEITSWDMLDYLITLGLQPGDNPFLPNLFIHNYHPVTDDYRCLTNWLEQGFTPITNWLDRGFTPPVDYFFHLVAQTKPFWVDEVDGKALANIKRAVEVLMEKGANPLLRDKDGKTPLEVAKRSLEDIKKAYGYDAGSKDIIGLFAAAEIWKAQEDCPICFEKNALFDSAKAPCEIHVFHPKCLDEWYSRNKSCPTCRKD